MKKTVKIQYHSIFRYPDYPYTIKYDVNGYLYQEDNYLVLSFYKDNNYITIKVSDDDILLINNNSTLKLVEDELIENEYDVGFGTINLNTKLISKDIGEHIKLKYQLIDGDKVLGDIYLMVKYILLEN